MNDAASPFTPPSCYNVCAQQQQPLQPEGTQKGEKKNRSSSSSNAAPLPFAYGARCAIYSIVLFFSLLCAIFSIIMMCSRTFLQITQNANYTHIRGSISSESGSSSSSSSSSNGNPFANIPMSRLTKVFALVDQNSSRHDCELFADTVKEAIDPLNPSFFLRGYTVCVKAPSGAAASGAAAIVAFIFGFLLFVLSCVVLGIMGCQRRRARSGTAADKATRDARVRQGLSITCLICSVVGVVMSIVGLATAVPAAAKIKKEVDAVQADYGEYIIFHTDDAATSAAVLFHIPNFVFFVITTVLLAVPYLSGIVDRAPKAAVTEDTYANATQYGDYGVTSLYYAN